MVGGRIMGMGTIGLPATEGFMGAIGPRGMPGWGGAIMGRITGYMAMPASRGRGRAQQSVSALLTITVNIALIRTLKPCTTNVHVFVLNLCWHDRAPPPSTKP